MGEGETQGSGGWLKKEARGAEVLVRVWSSFVGGASILRVESDYYHDGRWRSDGKEGRRTKRGGMRENKGRERGERRK